MREEITYLLCLAHHSNHENRKKFREWLWGMGYIERPSPGKWYWNSIGLRHPSHRNVFWNVELEEAAQETLEGAYGIKL